MTPLAWSNRAATYNVSKVDRCWLLQRYTYHNCARTPFALRLGLLANPVEAFIDQLDNILVAKPSGVLGIYSQVPSWSFVVGVPDLHGHLRCTERVAQADLA